MKKTLPFQLLIDLAKEEMDAAIRNLGELNRKGRDIDEKLQLLLQYRQEYQVRFDESSRKGIYRNEWQNYQNFIVKLDLAIDQQKRLQIESLRSVESARMEYQQKHRKLKSFETLLERHHAEESAKAARIEQKETDDFAGKSYFRKMKPEE